MGTVCCSYAPPTPPARAPDHLPDSPDRSHFQDGLIQFSHFCWPWRCSSWWCCLGRAQPCQHPPCWEPALAPQYRTAPPFSQLEHSEGGFVSSWPHPSCFSGSSPQDCGGGGPWLPPRMLKWCLSWDPNPHVAHHCGTVWCGCVLRSVHVGECMVFSYVCVCVSIGCVCLH